MVLVAPAPPQEWWERWRVRRIAWLTGDRRRLRVLRVVSAAAGAGLVGAIVFVDGFEDGFEVWAQRGDGLADRIADAFARCAGPALLVGMDTPQLTARHLVVDWAAHDAWFGPAEDGGFWALGLRAPDPGLVRGVPMSTDDTGAIQLARLHAAGLRVGMLPRLRDVDTPDCAAAVAGEAPGTRFAALHAKLAVHAR